MSNVYLDVLQVGGAMLLLIVLGWILSRFQIFSENEFKVLNSFTSKICLPLLVFNALAKQALSDISFLPLLNAGLMNVSCHIIIALVSLYPFSNRLEFFTSTQMASCYLNYVIIGLPIFTAIWGDESAKVAVICPFVHYIFLLPLYLILTHLLEIRKDSDGEHRGITLRDIGRGFLQSLKTPLILGAFGGLIWSAIGISPPIFVAQLSSYTGNVVVVISLLGIGSFLYANSIFACHILQLLLCLALRFVIGPALSALWAIAFRFPPTLARQCTILGAMPLSTVAYVVAVTTGVGVGAASSVVFWSVCLVVPVVMLWFYILDSLGIFVETE
jgi:predicted permease